MSDDAWDGRPENPERDGWHWVAWAGNPEPTLWTPHGPEKRGECWYRDGDWMGPGWVCANAKYLGPCALPAEIAALRADNERLRKALREIIDHCGNSAYGNPIVDNRTVDRCEDTARAALSEPAP